jgi:hypothetical protein
MHRLWDGDLLARVSQSEEVWLKELAALDTHEARDAAAKGTPEDWATRRACSRPGGPITCQRRASDSSPVKSSATPT